MMTDLDKETVDFTPNYDGNTEEPTVLPRRSRTCSSTAPRIAVGMQPRAAAQLREVVDACIWLNRDTHSRCRGAAHARRQASQPDQAGAAPDFPTGGYIIGRQGAVEAYMTARLDHDAREDRDRDQQEGRSPVDHRH